MGAVDAAFHDVEQRSPEDSAFVQHMYTHFYGGAPFSEEARAALHTQYHAVPKLEVAAPERIGW